MRRGLRRDRERQKGERRTREASGERREANGQVQGTTSRPRLEHVNVMIPVLPWTGLDLITIA